MTMVPTRSCLHPKPAPFDLLHARYERDVEPGELVMVSRDGSITTRKYARRHSAIELHF